MAQRLIVQEHEKLLLQRLAEPASTIAVAGHVTAGQKYEPGKVNDVRTINTKYTVAPRAFS
jgi:hypothetical protein